MFRIITFVSLIIIPIETFAQQSALLENQPTTEMKIKQLQADLDTLKASIAAPVDKQVNTTESLTDITWSLSGRIHRIIMAVDDGAETNSFFMDSDQGPTMIRLDAQAPQSSSGWTLGGRLEIGIQSNRSQNVSQDEPNPGTDLTVRDADIKFEHQKYGKFNVGRGFSAAWLAPEIDLSGTGPVALLTVGMFAPGMKFVDANSGELTDLRVRHFFVDTERLLLVDRVRYDSPSFYGGIIVSGTIAADSRWDTALRYYPNVEGWQVRSALTYQNQPVIGIMSRTDIALAAKHLHTGLSLSAGHSLSKREFTKSNSKAYVLKAGIEKHLFDIGSSAFSVDYTAGQYIDSKNDDVNSIGLVAAQHLDVFNTYIYVGLRRYSVNHTDINLEDLNVAAFGIRFSF